MSTQMPLPNFLPPPGDQLCNLPPLNHESLVSVLGLALGYLKALHPVKQPRAEMAATAHILNLFFNDPLTEALLPGAPTPGTPSKEFSNIQSKLTALENTVASLAKAGKTPTPPSQLAPPNQANAPLLKKGATVTQPTYAAK